MKTRRFPLLTALAALSLTLATGALAYAQPPAGKAQKGQRGQGNQRPGMNAKALAKELDLTKEQQEKLKPAFEKAAEARKKLREDTATAPKEKREKTKEITTELTKAIEEVLTAEQKPKFEAFKKKLAEAAKKGKKGTTPPPPPAH